MKLLLDFISNSDRPFGIELSRKILEEYPESDVYFGGYFPDYIDCMYVVVNTKLDYDLKDFFELRFRKKPKKSKIISEDDKRISPNERGYRRIDSDDYIWAAPDHLKYYNNPEYGNYAYLWWD